MLDLLTVFLTYYGLNSSFFVLVIEVFILCEKNNFNIKILIRILFYLFIEIFVRPLKFLFLLKKKIFKEVNNNFSKIKPVILKKFKKEILDNVNPKFLQSKIRYNINLGLMRKGYLKSAHLDRRDHLISGIYYPITKINKGGNLQLCSLTKKMRTFDVFPSKKNLKIIIDEVWGNNKDISLIIENYINENTNDDSELIDKLVKNVIEKNDKQIKEYKNGKTKIIGFFIGQVLKEAKGADPSDIKEKLIKLLDSI